jgi:hypothetical protein
LLISCPCLSIALVTTPELTVAARGRMNSNGVDWK